MSSFVDHVRGEHTPSVTAAPAGGGATAGAAGGRQPACGIGLEILPQ